MLKPVKQDHAPERTDMVIYNYPIIVTICVLFNLAQAQSAHAGTTEDDRDSLVRATKTMRRVDVNGNGTLEQEEDAAAWRRYQKLDVNDDQMITIDELRKQRVPYLKTSSERKLNLVYKTLSQRELLLDLYYPASKDAEAAAPYPVILYTHGGGWAAGSKQGIAKGSFSEVFQRLLDQGFAVASVDYRLCRKDGLVTMRDCVIDCKDAARYLAKNGNSLKLDPTRFFVMGDSAGGHIAQMLLLTSPTVLLGDDELTQASYQMLAGVSWYGPSDFEKTDLFNHDDRTDFRDRFGARILGADPAPETKLQRYREMSPVNYLKQDSPPLLMIQGDKDTTIPVKHAYYMKEKAESIKAPVEILIVKNAGHNWRKVDADIDPDREAIIDRTVQFFIDHLPN